MESKLFESWLNSIRRLHPCDAPWVGLQRIAMLMPRSFVDIFDEAGVRVAVVLNSEQLSEFPSDGTRNCWDDRLIRAAS